MQGYKPIGTLSPSTLAYTVGGIIISLPIIDKIVPEIHKALLDEYPQFSQMEIDMVKPDPLDKMRNRPVQVTQHAINNSDRSWGVLFSGERILLQTTKYEGFTHFSEKFRKILEVVQEITGLTDHNGVAFRHIDNIYPLDSKEELDSAIQQKYLTPQIDTDTDSQQSRHEYIYSQGHRKLLCRLYFFNDRGPTLPEDLYTNFIGLKNKTPDNLEQSSYVLADFEATSLSFDKTQKFEIDSMVTELDELHQFVSISYRHIITPEELKARGGKS